MTGPFLWWPKEWNWNNLKKITLFRGGAWGRARDWNWHNVLGFWCVAAVIPDCAHGRDHVLRVGKQSALPHDREYASASGSGCSSERRRNASRGWGSGEIQTRLHGSRNRASSRDSTSYSPAPACRFRTGRPSACACQITAARTHSPFPSIVAMAAARICVRSLLWTASAEKSCAGNLSPATTADDSSAPGPVSLIPARLEAWLGQTLAAIVSTGCFLAGVYRALAWGTAAPGLEGVRAPVSFLSRSIFS